MKLIKLLTILLLTTAISNAEMTWYVYISTDPPHFYNSGERVIKSTDTVQIDFPNKEADISCTAWKPYYFWPEGFPYPLNQHRYLECDLGKDYAVATQVQCNLRKSEVKETIILVQTPAHLYEFSFQCYNDVGEIK